MRDLDAINPGFLKPSRFAGFSACTLSALVLISIPLAYGAAPTIPLLENIIVLLVGVVFLVSAGLALLAFVFRWGWESRYYGASLLCLGSISFLAIVPCFALMFYSSTPFWVKLMILISYGASHTIWCRRFFKVYKRIFGDKVMRSIIYSEDPEAVYYVRRGDEFLLEKTCKFEQIPQARYFVLFLVIALAMVPAIDILGAITGLPFVHIFLLVSMLPVSWMSIGLAVRAYLIFYFYPNKIRRETGKVVYVDLVSNGRLHPFSPSERV